MDLKIRIARVKDKETILSVIGSYPCKWDRRIAKRYYDDYFSNKPICLQEDKIYVLTLNNRIIGVIGYSLDKYETNNYWLGWFYVHKKYQGKGYAKRLLDYIARKLKRKGARKIFVDTSSDEFYNRALTLYLDNGFRIEATIRDYYGNKEDQIILSKLLT